MDEEKYKNLFKINNEENQFNTLKSNFEKKSNLKDSNKIDSSHHVKTDWSGSNKDSEHL